MLYRNYVVLCDVCKDASPRAEEADDAKAYAFDSGWVEVDGKDVCPKCAK